MMVVLRTRKREMRRDGGNHHEKLGLKRISCASQFIILDTVGTTPDPAGKNTNTRYSKPNQASCTPDHVSSLGIPAASCISLARAQHNIKSSLSISSCHNHELTPTVLVQSRRRFLRGETGPFTERTHPP